LQHLLQSAAVVAEEEAQLLQKALGVMAALVVVLVRHLMAM
jgi:hypothetical protein